MDYETTRWISRDPLGEGSGVNLYDYVGNNPISGLDPLGLFNSGEFWSGIGNLSLGVGGIAVLATADLGTGGLATAAVVLGAPAAAWRASKGGAQVFESIFGKQKCPNDPGNASQLPTSVSDVASRMTGPQVGNQLKLAEDAFNIGTSMTDITNSFDTGGPTWSNAFNLGSSVEGTAEDLSEPGNSPNFRLTQPTLR